MKLSTKLRAQAMELMLAGEKIVEGSNNSLMLEASNDIETLSAEIAKLENDAVAWALTVVNLRAERDALKAACTDYRAEVEELKVKQ
jgi:outer membrane murein-binding lipoprotein Lpp